MNPPYNVHLTQNSVQCKPWAKIVHLYANRSSVVGFLTASGFLRQKTHLVKTKEIAFTSYTYIFFGYPHRKRIELKDKAKPR